jgi:hypothetical protein
MEDKLPRLSPACFAAAALFFFLPFLTVSCQGKPLAKMTGIQTMTGTTVDLAKVFDGATFGDGELKGLKFDPSAGSAQTLPNGMQFQPNQKVGGSALAVLSFACALCGVALFFVPPVRTGAVPALAGLAGLVLMFVNKSSIASKLQEPTMGMVRVDAEYGFWLAALAFGAAVLVNARVALAPAGEAEAAAPRHAGMVPPRPAAPVGRAYPTFDDPNPAAAASSASVADPAPPPRRAPIPVAGVEEHEPATRR